MIFDFFSWGFSNILVYILGCVLEILGFALLFNKNFAQNKFTKKNHVWIGFIIAVIGYIVALIGRGEN